MLLAIFVVTVTYVAGMRPPGGTWEHAQEAGRSDAGEPIWLERHRGRFMAFLISNTIALVASLAVVMLVLSSRLRRNMSCLPLHVFIITMALLGLLGAYVSGSCTEWIFTVQVGCVVGAIAVILLCVSCLPIVECLFGGFKSQHHSLAGAPGCRVTIQPLVPIVPVGEGEPVMAGTPGLPRMTPTESTMVVHRQHSSEAHANPLKNGRSMILLLAILTATVTYQAGLEPPGGVWRDNEGGHNGGGLILLATHAIRYKVFFYCNSAAFVASIIVVIILQSKDLVNRYALHAAIILDLMGLMGAYAAGSWRDIGASLSIFVLVAAIIVLLVVTYIVSCKSLTRGNNGNVSLAEQKRKRELQKRQKLLLNLAVLAITITYQAGLTPPGGFWIEHADEEHHNGDPVLGDNHRGWYTAFFFCNTTSFMASVVTIVSLVSQSLSEIDMAYCKALYCCVFVVLAGLTGAFACGTSRRMQESMYVLGLASLGLTLAILYIHRSHPMVRNGDGSYHADDDTELVGDVVTNGQHIITHKMCKYLVLISILAATITYQAGLTPPGDVWPAADDGEGHAAGDPILRDSDRRHYLAFLYSNSVSFAASVLVIVLLLRGVVVRKLSSFLPLITVVHAVAVVDFLALLAAYATGSSRDRGTSVYVVTVAATVLVYIAIYAGLSSRHCGREQDGNGGVGSPTPPREWLLDLGKGGAHDTNAHNMFDGMPSQPEVFNDDERISETVPIKSTMKKEGISMDKALDRLLEKFELMEANPPTKCLTECPNNNITWVAANSNHIGEMLAPTAAWELGDRKDMDQAPYIATKDLPKVTPTKCSTLCSSFDNKPDLTVAVVVTCATSVKSLMELVATDSTTSGTHIDTPDSTKAMPTNCLMFGMMVNTGTIQTGVVFPLFLDKLDIVTVLTLHWARLKPWPPPHEDDLTYILVNQREVELWRTILVDHNKEGLLMIIELYVLDLNDCCLSWSHLILTSVLVVELSSTRQCGYEIISFKSNHVDKLKLFGMSINVLEQCEHLEGDLIRLIIKEKLMPWNSGMGICLCCLLVIQLPVGKLKWNVSVISLFHLLITKVNEFPRGITTGASYKVLYGAEKLLNLNAEDKSYTRVKSFEEGASSVQYKVCPFGLVPASVVLDDVAYTTSGTTWHYKCLTDKMRMPRAEVNHKPMWTRYLSKQGCHSLQHTKMLSLNVGKKINTLLLLYVTQERFKGIEKLSARGARGYILLAWDKPNLKKRGLSCIVGLIMSFVDYSPIQPNKAQLERQQSSTNKVLGSHRTEQASAASATAAAAS
uniref:PGG domain-containing protein n=1 Tax=Oryza nivara TaxID=4536 RepID=A0A0E0HPA2_ORYNI